MPVIQSSKAVFLSYASEDASVATRLRDALRNVSIEVWFDQSELRGGDAWDQTIRQQIRDCALFVPIISENTQTRPEGYFRLEWKLAVDRSHLMAAEKAFIVPVVVDATTEPEALVPAQFREVQWTRMQAGVVPAALVDRIAALLNQPVAHHAGSAGRGAIRAPTGRLPIALIALSAAVVAGFVIAAALRGGWSWHKPVPKVDVGPASASVATSPATIPEKSIAVLPFENRSAKQDDAYFTDGIHDDILTQLTKIGAIKVIARTSVEQFRHTRLTTREIGAKLGVSRVLEGGVQRAGDRVRVTVQLIDAPTDAHLWAESYDRKLTASNIFSIQSEIAAAIANALKAALTPAEQARVKAVQTKNLDAWEAYQLGKQRMANRNSAGLADAERFLQRAINLDPGFALAYSALADTLIMQIGWAGVPEATNLPRAEQLARKALELDPTLTESWATSAYVAEIKGEEDRAEVEYRKAIAISPNNATAYARFASFLEKQSRLEEALTYSTKSLDLDPLSPGASIINARNLQAVGRFDEAATRLRRVIELDPLRPGTYLDLAWLNAYAWNRFVEAIPLAARLVELDPSAPYTSCTLAYLYVDLGDLIQAEQVLEVARKRNVDSAQLLQCLATVRYFQGKQAEAARLERQALAIEPSLPSEDSTYFGLAGTARGDYVGARSRYLRAFPQLLRPRSPEFSNVDLGVALDFAYILRMTGEGERANLLLDRVEQEFRKMPRLGVSGYGIADVQALALRGEKTKALVALRAAEKAGWRLAWRYYRDFVPSLTSIRNEPDFKAVFADIERDMARQRSELAARPRNAPLEFKPPLH